MPKARKPSRIALIANTRRRNSRKVVLGVVRWFERRGIEVLLETTLGDFLGKPGLSRSDSELKGDAEFVLAAGGDGTILRAAKIFKGTSTPVLGVNLGSLGFLAAAKLGELYTALEDVLNGQYETEKRMMVQAILIGPGVKTASFTALNDIVISKTAASRALRMKLVVSGKPLGNFTADGLIVSTPTGSTAYSLSAGGPIIKPTMTAILATPICPHSLAARPIVVSGDEVLQLMIAPRDATATITADGHESTGLSRYRTVEFRRARDTVNLVCISGRSFYDVLREKFRWGGVPARDARGSQS